MLALVNLRRRITTRGLLKKKCHGPLERRIKRRVVGMTVHGITAKNRFEIAGMTPSGIGTAVVAGTVGVLGRHNKTATRGR